MTTVAWKDGIVAADTMGDHNGLKMPTTKILVAKAFVLGGAGGAHDFYGYFDAMKDSSLKEVLENGYPVEDQDEDIPAMILVSRSDPSKAWFLAATAWLPIVRPYHAIGSGRDFAIAAMHLGKSAVEAVDIAMQFDVYTGGRVERVDAEHGLVEALQ